MRAPGFISDKELLGHMVSKAGLEPPSPSQLKRLRREGLLQPAHQSHQAGRAGSESIYPESAIEQLIGVLRIRREVRSFDQTRFWAWWDELWVAPRQLRNTLVRVVAAHVRPAVRLMGGRADPAEAADAVFANAPVPPVGPPGMRERVGKDVQDVLYAMVVFMAGGVPLWTGPDPDTDEDEERREHRRTDSLELLMERAVDLPALTSTDATSVGPLVIDPPPMSVVFEDLAGAGIMNVRSWTDVVRAASMSDLNGARDMSRAWIEDLPFILAVDASKSRPEDAVSLLETVVRTRGAFDARVQWIPMALLLRRSDPEFSQTATIVRIEAAKSRKVLREYEQYLKKNQ